MSMSFEQASVGFFGLRAQISDLRVMAHGTVDLQLPDLQYRYSAPLLACDTAIMPPKHSGRVDRVFASKGRGARPLLSESNPKLSEATCRALEIRSLRGMGCG